MVDKNTGAGLRGQSAGETAICTVGAAGNSLRYRGYDVVELAEQSTFYEVAHLILKGHLPNQNELDAYKAKIHAIRELPEALREVLEKIPADAHPGLHVLLCARGDALRRTGSDEAAAYYRRCVDHRRYQIGERHPATADALTRWGAALAETEREAEARVALTEAAEIYDEAGEADRAANEVAEREVLQAYLPEPLSPQELESLVASVIDEGGYETKKDMGAAIKGVMAKAGGRADGKSVSAVVGRLLN